MDNQQEVEKFWAKFGKTIVELQHDFAELSPQGKQVIVARISDLLKMRGIAVSANFLMNALSNPRLSNNQWNSFR